MRTEEGRQRGGDEKVDRRKESSDKGERKRGEELRRGEGRER